jgi:hypothetical protein
MAESAHLGYLQARLQARHGQRPADAEWRLLESSNDLLHFIDALRTTELKRWVRGISPDSSAAEMERLLRANWRDGVVQAAHWAPPQWQDALLWCRWLPELPTLSHLLEGGAVRPWMQDDPVASGYAFDAPRTCIEALGDTELSPMQVFLWSDPKVRFAWTAVFKRVSPASRSKPVVQAMSQLEGLLEEHRENMLMAEAGTAGQSMRRDLGKRLLRIFRRASGTVAALFAFLGLEALEVERVRAGLVTRRLLKRVPEGMVWA